MLTVTATNLPRLMACNGSRLIEGETPSINNDDDTVKNEGIAADWVVRQFYDHGFEEELIGQKAPNGIYITAEMLEYLEDYLIDVSVPKSSNLIEVETICTGKNWQVNGRADLIKYDSNTQHLYVGDLKYGWSIVEPKDNWTLIAHAVGYVEKHRLTVKNLTLTIYQPRPYHSSGAIRSHTYDGVEFGCFYQVMDNTLSSPTNVLNTGNHCNHCSALNLDICPAARNAKFNAIDASEKAFVETISNESLSFQLDHLKRAVKFLTITEKAYKELASHRLRQGQVIENYTLNNDLANRTWQKHITSDTLKMLTGKTLTEENFFTPAQAEKAGVSEKIVKALTHQINKGTKLVRMDANTKAEKLFKKEK